MNINYIDLLPIIKHVSNTLLPNGNFSAIDYRGKWTVKNATDIQLIISNGFDKDKTTYLRTSTAGTINKYIEVNFPNKYLIGKYKLELGNYNDRYGNMKAWNIWAQVDGIWVVVHSGENIQGTATKEHTFEPVLTNKIRIECTEKYGNNSWGFDDFYVYEVEYEVTNKSLILHNGEYKKWDSINGWVTVSSSMPTKNQFIDDGMDDLLSISNSIDELNGNFKIVTWTDDSVSSPYRTLTMNAIPKPLLIYPLLTQVVLGEINSISTNDLSTNPSNVRYLFSSDNNQWRYYNTAINDFENVTSQDYKALGNTIADLPAIDFTKWIDSNFNVGIYLEDSADDTQVSHVEKLGVNYSLPSNTPTLSNINFYILNTTARIDLELAGLSLTGSLSDADLTRVQYKVTLNGEPFFPKNGEFTTLSEPPQNINITMKTSDIKMMDWNTLRVDFRDFFGTEDYWQTTFVGNYASLMFKDVDGNYYSDDVGQVLQYLDFGNIVAGEVTVSHEIILKNQYGYAVKDIEIVPNTSYLPEGVSIEMSKTNDPFIPESDLLYTEGLADSEELSFFVRMNTDVNSIPNEHNKFDVFVKASRKDVNS